MTGLHVPGVNLHPPAPLDQLRRALSEYEASAHSEWAAHNVVDAARALLAEIDGEAEHIGPLDPR